MTSSEQLPDYNIFVFGNGYDLAHSLETSYASFFYFLDALKDWNAHHNQWQALQKEKFEKNNFPSPTMYNYLYDNLKKPVNLPHYLNTIMETLHFEHDNNSENIWHQYFSQQFCHNISKVTWIDFETAIYDLISQIKNIKPASDYLQNIYKIMKLHNFQFPDPLQSIVRTLSHNDTSASRAQLQKEVVLYLHNELLKYIFCFELYLKYYVLSAGKNIPSPTFIDTLLSSSLKTQPHSRNFILSFNYTDTVEQICSDSMHIPLPTIQHIHGRIRNAEDLDQYMDDPEFQLKSPLVLGFHNNNSEENCDGSPFLWFEKFYQRIILSTTNSAYHAGNTQPFHEWLKLIQQGEEYKYLVAHPYSTVPSDFKLGNANINAIFYGHSLDSTDADMIQKIFSVATSVVIYYYSKTELPTLLANLTKSLGKEEVENICMEGKLTFLPIPADIPARSDVKELQPC